VLYTLSKVLKINSIFKTIVGAKGFLIFVMRILLNPEKYFNLTNTLQKIESFSY